MDALLASPITYVVGSLALIALLVGLAVWMERRTRQRYERLIAEGEPAEATVLSAKHTGVRTNGRPHIRVALEVRRPGQPPYQATTVVSTPERWSPLPFWAGVRVRVRVDRDDPRQVAIEAGPQPAGSWLGPPVVTAGGAAHVTSSVYVLGGRGHGSAEDLPPEARAALAQAAALLGDADGDGLPDALGGARADAAARLRELQRLRDEGLISAEEHARKRAEIIGEL